MKNLNLNLGRGGVPLSLDRTCDLRRIFAGAGRNRRYLRGSSNQKLEGKIEFMGLLVIFGSSGAVSRPAWTRMVAVVYGSEGGELGFPSAAQ